MDSNLFKNDFKSGAVANDPANVYQTSTPETVTPPIHNSGAPGKGKTGEAETYSLQHGS